MRKLINVLAGASLVFTSTLLLTLPADAANFKGHARVTIEGGLKVSAGIKLPKPFGGRKFTVVIKGTRASFSSPATCLFPFDLKFETPVAQFNMGAIESVFKNAKSFVPDGKTLTKCAGQIFYAMADGVVYAFSETAEIASLAVTDPVAAAKKIGAGIKMVNGKISEAPGEAAEAALKIGGKLGKLGANVGGEVVGQLSDIGGSALNAGRAASNAVRNIGGGIASGARRVGCKLGLGGCKKKRRPAPGRKVAWSKLRGSGWDIAASANTADKIWVVGGDYRLFLFQAGLKKFAPTYAYLKDGTEIRNFAKVSVGPRDSLLIAGKLGRLYYSDGKRNGNKITVTLVPRVQAFNVGIRKSVAWISSGASGGRGQIVRRSKFDGTLKSLNFKDVKGGEGVTALDVDALGNAWIVVNRKDIKRYTGKGWQNIAPLLDATSAQKYQIQHITVDDHYRPWVSLSGTKYNVFALTPNGWLQHQGGMLNLSARGKHLWGIGSGGKRNFYKAPLPAYTPEAPADDWRYTLASEAANDDDYCLYTNMPTRTVSMVGQPVVLKACANAPVPQEQFFMQNIDGKYIRIISSATKLCAGLGPGHKINGGQIQLLPCSAKDHRQQWLLKTQNGSYSLQSRFSSKCLGVVGKVAKAGGTLEQTTCSTGNEQKFQIASLHKEKLAGTLNSRPALYRQSPSTWVRVLQVREGDRCMSNNPKYRSAYSWTCGGNNKEQQMQIGGNKYQKGFTTIYSLTQKKCLSAYVAKVENVRKNVNLTYEVDSRPCNLRAPTQAWGRLPTGQGYYLLINRQFGLCVTRPKGSMGPNNRFDLTKCNASADSQNFRDYNVIAK